MLAKPVLRLWVSGKAPANDVTGAPELLSKEMPGRSEGEFDPTFLFSPQAAITRTELRRIVREELRANQDRQSFVAASPWLKRGEAQDHLNMTRTEFFDRLAARKIAKTDEAKDAAFAPWYGEGRLMKFHRDELDAWVRRQRH